MPGRQKVDSRPIEGLEDVMRVREFLSKTYRRTRNGLNWEVRRWDGTFWHRREIDLSAGSTTPSDRFRMWESAGDRILGVANPEGKGEAHLQIDPGHRYLEDEMLEWAEGALSTVLADGRLSLTTFSLAGDEVRTPLLRRRGYRIEPWSMVQRWRNLDRPLPDVRAGKRYTIRSLRPQDEDDATALASLINASFDRSFDAETILNFEESPAYRADLHIIAEAPDGTHAAHAGVTIDEVAKLAIVEPVCTHPEHRRRKLASATMAEGLERARKAGAKRATVGTGTDNPSNHVYSSLGFSEAEYVYAWSKVWTP